MMQQQQHRLPPSSPLANSQRGPRPPPALPPIPSGLRDELRNSHPASSSSRSLLVSPIPKRPAGGAVDTTTTRILERAASANVVNQLHQPQLQPQYLSSQAQSRQGPSQSGAVSKVNSMQGNSRIEHWRATSAQPGFAEYANSTRGTTPVNGQYGAAQPHQQQPYYGNGQQANGQSSSYYQQQQQYHQNAPAIALHASPPPVQRPTSAYSQQTPVSQHPPRSSSWIDPRHSVMSSPAAMHHSFSDLSLSASGGTGMPARGPSPGPPNTNNGHLAQGGGQHARASTYSLDPSSAAAQAQSSGRRSRRSSSYGGAASPAPSSGSSDPTAVPPTLCIALPSQTELSQQRDGIAYAPNPGAAKVAWAKAVLKFVELHQASSSAGGEFGKITDPVLVKWTDEAIRAILAHAEMQPPVPEALYLRGELSNSGKFPSYRTKDASAAFRDFEAAANLGYIASWAKIALAYETFGEQNNSQADFDRAKKAYEEGMRKNEVTCTYRIAMAYLLGQLGYTPNPSAAVPTLRTAASLSTIDDPLPAYIYGMLLSGELDLGPSAAISSIPPTLLLNDHGQPSDPKPWIERSAYLGYAPAQFKMGFCYEYASLGCGYDPLLSVQYYSLASQQGDIEADMALSKWFLCGSEAFDLQESLAFTFAEKAAKKGLPSAEFALGYYHEIGIGGRKDVETSKIWYSRAAGHGNKDAQDRLAALANDPAGQLDRTQHESQINDKIVRKRTQAKVEADSRRSTRPPRNSSISPYSNTPVPPVMPTSDSNTSLRRRETMRQVEEAAQAGRRQSQLSQSFGPSNGSGNPGGFAVPPSASSPQLSARPPPRSREGSLAVPAGPVQRYSLIDSGPVASSPSTVSGASSNSSGNAVPIVNKPPAAVGPQTFEAMGLKTGKVKADQECIIA